MINELQTNTNIEVVVSLTAPGDLTLIYAGLNSVCRAICG